MQLCSVGQEAPRYSQVSQKFQRPRPQPSFLFPDEQENNLRLVSDHLSTVHTRRLLASPVAHLSLHPLNSPLPRPGPYTPAPRQCVWLRSLQHGALSPGAGCRAAGWLQGPVLRATRVCPRGREVKHCSPAPSRGLGWHWVRHPGGVLIEEGALGFQECPEGVHSQTTASSEPCCWKCPVRLCCSFR